MNTCKLVTCYSTCTVHNPPTVRILSWEDYDPKSTDTWRPHTDELYPPTLECELKQASASSRVFAPVTSMYPHWELHVDEDTTTVKRFQSDKWGSLVGCGTPYPPSFTVEMNRIHRPRSSSCMMKVVPWSTIPYFNEPTATHKARVARAVNLFEIVTVLLACFDVVSDVLVVREYYNVGLMGWFWTSFALILTSNMFLSVISLVSINMSDGRSFGKPGVWLIFHGYCTDSTIISEGRCTSDDWKPILISILLIPIGQCLPLIQWLCATLLSTTNDTPPDDEDNNAKLEKTNETKKLFQRHVLFFAETIAESIPQSIIQLIVIVLHHDSVTAIQVVSLCISLLSICSKAYQVVRTRDTILFIGCQLIVISDILSLFFCYLTLFSTPPFKFGSTHTIPFLSSEVSLFTHLWYHKVLANFVIWSLLGIGLYMWAQIQDYRETIPTVTNKKTIVAGMLCRLLLVVIVGAFVLCVVVLFEDFPRFSLLIALWYLTGPLGDVWYSSLHSHKLIDFLGTKDIIYRFLTGNRTPVYDLKMRFLNAYVYDKAVARYLTVHPRISVKPFRGQWHKAQCSICERKIECKTICQFTSQHVLKKRAQQQLQQQVQEMAPFTSQPVTESSNSSDPSFSPHVIPPTAITTSIPTNNHNTDVDYDDRLSCEDCFTTELRLHETQTPTSSTEPPLGYVCTDSRIGWCYYNAKIFRVNSDPFKDRELRTLVNRSTTKHETHKIFPLSHIKFGQGPTHFITRDDYGRPRGILGRMALISGLGLLGIACIVHIYSFFLPILLATTIVQWDLLQLFTGLGSVSVLVLGLILVLPRMLLYNTIKKDSIAADPFHNNWSTLETEVPLSELVNEFYSKSTTITVLPVLLHEDIPFDIALVISSFLSEIDVVIRSKTEREVLTHRFAYSNIPFQLFYPELWAKYPTSVLKRPENDTAGWGRSVVEGNHCPGHLE